MGDPGADDEIVTMKVETACIGPASTGYEWIEHMKAADVLENPSGAPAEVWIGKRYQA